MFGLWYAGPTNITGNNVFGQIGSSSPLGQAMSPSDTSGGNSSPLQDNSGQIGMTNSAQQNLQPSLTIDESGTPLQKRNKDFD